MADERISAQIAFDSPADKAIVSAFLTLRNLVGILGMSLPIAVSVGAWIIKQTKLQGSISAYYYTITGDLFVGLLFAIGVFMLSYRNHVTLLAYRDYGLADARAGVLAGVTAMCVALFPTKPEDYASRAQEVIGGVHLASATIFFATLTYFSLVLFRRTSGSKDSRTLRKRLRDNIYFVCGWIMASCLVLLLVNHFVNFPLRTTTFWLEATAIFAFGISWFTKGEALGLLSDK